MIDSKVQKVYAAKSLQEQEKAYDDWAMQYEQDLCAMGYRGPAVVAGMFARHLPSGTTPILDAGCGGGLQSEPLAAMGYRGITGIDLSEGMMKVAASKGIYAELKQQTLGETLDFPDDHFAAVLTCGVITPGHAPAHSFDELLRVTKAGGIIVSSLRDDPEQLPEYPAALDRLEKAGKWELVDKSDSFQTMPYGEPEVTHVIYVYRVL